MARTFSQPSTTYTPNLDGSPQVYGPFALNGYNRNTAEYIEWTATVENWPLDVNLLLFSVAIDWDVGYRSTREVYGDPRNRDGTPITKIVERVPIPREGAGAQKAQTTSGTITLTVYSPVTTAFTAAVV